MSEETTKLVKRIRTESGDLQIDYNALANIPDLDSYMKKDLSEVSTETFANFGLATQTYVNNQIKNQTEGFCKIIISDKTPDEVPTEVGAVLICYSAS